MNVNPKVVASEICDSWVPLLEIAAREVFERMLASRLLPAPELIAAEEMAAEEMDVASMVGLAGQICGVMIVRCTTKAAVLMASKMLGVEAAQADAEMWDAVGEVCNMIAGNFKSKITGMGDGCMLSVPTVITGVDYNLHPLVDSRKTDVQFRFEEFPLVISLEIHS